MNFDTDHAKNVKDAIYYRRIVKNICEKSITIYKECLSDNELPAEDSATLAVACVAFMEDIFDVALELLPEERDTIKKMVEDSLTGCKLTARVTEKKKK